MQRCDRLSPEQLKKSTSETDQKTNENIANIENISSVANGKVFDLLAKDLSSDDGVRGREEL